MNSRRLLVLSLFLAAALPPAAAKAWVSKDIRDWNVECTNGLTCEMGFADWGAKGVQWIAFQRKGAPDAPVVLTLRMTPDSAPDNQSGLTYDFTIDGQTVLTLTEKDFQPEPDGASFLYSDQAKVIALMDAMEAGTAMELSVTGGQGKQVLPVKLSGVKGAMLYMDEVQGRLGRTDALEARGDTPPPTDAAVKDIAALDDMPDILRKDFTESGGACADIDPETIGQFEGFDVTLGTSRLIVVPCGTGGAYNQPYAAYVGYDVIFERISFPYMKDGKPTTMSTAYNIDFNPVTRRMTSFFKGRGLGDCGQFYTWTFDDAASSLVFLEERAKGECDEKEGGPETFPIVWQARP